MDETGYIRRMQQEDMLGSLALHKIISPDDNREQLAASYHFMFPSFPWRIGRFVRCIWGLSLVPSRSQQGLTEGMGNVIEWSGLGDLIDFEHVASLTFPNPLESASPGFDII
jgi:hypothetical protein